MEAIVQTEGIEKEVPEGALSPQAFFIMSLAKARAFSSSAASGWPIVEGLKAANCFIMGLSLLVHIFATVSESTPWQSKKPTS